MSDPGNSTGRILSILDLFSEDRLTWRPDALMDRLGLTRPTLYRYLKTLRDAGFIMSQPDGSVTLGPRATELDYLMRRSDPLIRHGASRLSNLVQTFPCAALLVRWYGNKLLCVASHTSTDRLQSGYPRGRPMPLGRGAISRVIIANLPKRHQVPLIERNLSDFEDCGQGKTVSAVLEALRGVRRDGYAVARGEVTPGVIAVSAPILDARRVPIAALTASSAQTDVDAATLRRIIHDVCTLAGDITSDLNAANADISNPLPNNRSQQ